MLHGIACAVALASASVVSGSPGAAPTGKTARAEIKGPSLVGLATFTEEKNGEGVTVVIRVMVKGLTPGVHGVHLHAVGKCEPTFDAAGGHFDPGPAGNPDPDVNHPFHMGDIPPLNVGATGAAPYETRTTRVTLSDGPLSLFDADGSAIVIHGNPDQGIAGPSRSGVSGGPRIGCGVIVRQ